MANPLGIGGPQPGEVRNIEGKNGHNKGWQPYGQRLQIWMVKDVSELEALLLNDGAALRKLSAIDAICARHVINSISGKATLQHLKEALDRIEGTPKQTHILQGDADKPVAHKFTLDFGTPINDGSPVPTPEAIPKAE